jgi:hypothetical protein
MEMDVGPYEAMEIEDALVACDDLRAVIARLKRLGLLTDDENRQTREQIQAITETLAHKLPPEE